MKRAATDQEARAPRSKRPRSTAHRSNLGHCPPPGPRRSPLRSTRPAGASAAPPRQQRLVVLASRPDDPPPQPTWSLPPRAQGRRDSDHDTRVRVVRLVDGQQEGNLDDRGPRASAAAERAPDDNRPPPSPRHVIARLDVSGLVLVPGPLRVVRKTV